MLHYRHNSFYAPVTPSERDWRQRKEIINKETDKTAIMLYSLKKEIGHERPKDKSTNKKTMRKYPHPDMNQTPPTYPIAHPPTPPPSFIITIQWTQNSWYK